MSRVLAYDPGNKETAWVLFDGTTVIDSGYVENSRAYEPLSLLSKGEQVAIEMIASYGMAVGAEVFETAVWVGKIERQAEIMGLVTRRIFRMECKMNLCHNSRAKDPNIRQALIDRFGAPGTKKKPGPLFGISGDKWAALAVAVTFYDKHIKGVL